jgi:hypothetical protein
MANLDFSGQLSLSAGGAALDLLTNMTQEGKQIMFVSAVSWMLTQLHCFT